MKLTIKLSALSKLNEDGHQKKFYVRSAAIIVINRPILNPRKFKLFSVGSICSVKKVLGLELLILLFQDKRIYKLTPTSQYNFSSKNH
ncbi:hypothetical protein ASE55_05925 [Chryseobacterium sp. Leaf201]|nr:hypothetical protein ASE55_05925 [Chryseobacterium sp. Leaf201]